MNIVSPGNPNARYQLEYDRCFDRIVDNSKILELAGLTQYDLMPVKDALKMEYDALPADVKWHHTDINDRMDDYLKSIMLHFGVAGHRLPIPRQKNGRSFLM